MTAQELRTAVINAAMGSYVTVGHNPLLHREADTGFDRVFVPSLRRVETVLQDSFPDEEKLSGFLEMRNNGMEVWMLVPLSKMGRAHSELRQAADKIQAWWWDKEDGRVKFGFPEVP